MKSFAVNAEHDIVIENNVLQLTEGAELKRQTAECNLNTKIGEWFMNDELGMDFYAILGKKEIDNDVIRGVILDALLQVDETFKIDKLSTTYDKRNRKLKIECTAVTADGEVVELSETWG